MYYRMAREFLERRFSTIGAAISLTVVVIFIGAEFVKPFEQWLQRVNLWGAILVLLLVEVLHLLTDIKYDPRLGIKVYASQNKISASELEFVRHERPSHVDLIEYSTFTIPSLLETLRENNCEFRLLVKDPASALNDRDRRTIVEAIVRSREAILSRYDKYEMRCYSVPASIRGRCFAKKAVSIGWYTYSSGLEYPVYGHDNALIFALTDNEEGKALQDTFVRAFDWLWNHPNTIPVQQALESAKGT